jgi:hypothetical protein
MSRVLLTSPSFLKVLITLIILEKRKIHIVLFCYELKNKCNFMHSSMALEPFIGPRPPLQFRYHFAQTVGLLGLGISPSQGHYLQTGQHKHRINAHKYTCLRVGFEITIPAFERAKTFRLRPRGHCDRLAKCNAFCVCTTQFNVWRK